MQSRAQDPTTYEHTVAPDVHYILPRRGKPPACGNGLSRRRTRQIGRSDHESGPEPVRRRNASREMPHARSVRAAENPERPEVAAAEAAFTRWLAEALPDGPPCSESDFASSPCRSCRTRRPGPGVASGADRFSAYTPARGSDMRPRNSTVPLSSSCMRNRKG